MDNLSAFLLGLFIGYLILGVKYKSKKEKRRTLKEWWEDQNVGEKILIILFLSIIVIPITLGIIISIITSF